MDNDDSAMESSHISCQSDDDADTGSAVVAFGGHVSHTFDQDIPDMSREDAEAWLQHVAVAGQ